VVVLLALRLVVGGHPRVCLPLASAPVWWLCAITARLAAELGVEFALHMSGALQWADSPAEQEHQRERVAQLAVRGYQAEWITRAEALAFQPGLAIADGVAGVAWYAGDGWVDAPRLVRALVNRALAEGAEVWRDTPVQMIHAERGRVTGVSTEKGTAAVDALAVCAGVESAVLLEPLGVTLPLRRVPGLLAVTTPPAAPLDRVVYAPGVHLRPDVDGGLRVGADEVDALAGPDTSPDALALLAYDLIERAARAFPSAAGVGLDRVHLGVRPVPEDGVSVAGHVPGLTNAWVAVTHSGITLGPLLGRLLAEEITGAPPDPRLTPFRPDRFRTAR
jgi:glycine/D-amino acid oxidase-like deaminating enzyme